MERQVGFTIMQIIQFIWIETNKNFWFHVEAIRTMKKNLDTIIREIKNEKDLDYLIRDFNEFIFNFSCDSDLDTYKDKVMSEYKDRIITLLGENNNISYDESSEIWDYAYSSRISNSIGNVISVYEEIASLYNYLLKIHNM